MSIPRKGASSRHAGNPRSRLFYSVTGKVAGQFRVLKGRVCLFKRVCGRHQLYAPPAWAEDRSALIDARDAGCAFVVLRERATGRWWVAPLSCFEKHGFRVDRGHGVQVGLLLRYWRSGFELESLFHDAEFRNTPQETPPAYQAQLFEPSPIG